MASIIQVRRDTAANWGSVNPVLANGEIGYETDTYKIKVGDGTSTYSALTYLSADTVAWGNLIGNLSDQTDLQNALDSKSDTTHQHSKSDITDFNDADYATAAQGSKADTALQTLSSSSIKDLSDVLSSMSPTDGQVLTYDTVNGWQSQDAPVTGIADVVSDTTPQLGGDLDLNGHVIKNEGGSYVDVDGFARFQNVSGTSADTNMYVYPRLATGDVWLRLYDHPDNSSTDKIFLRYDANASQGYLGVSSPNPLDINGLKWPTTDGTSGQAMVTDGSGNLSFSNAGVTDHNLLSNIGTNTHYQLDSHLADTTKHFTQSEISITESQISDLGSYLSSSASVNDLSDVVVTTPSNGQALTYNNGNWENVTLVDNDTTDHTLLTNIGTNTHDQIDSHLADTTKHFTQSEINHTLLTNIGTNTHDQIDSHLADTTKHFTQNEISITESQISDLGSYLTNSSSIKDLSDVLSSMSPTDGQVLTYDTANGWQSEDAPVTGITKVQDDSNPILGGNLRTDAKYIYSLTPNNLIIKSLDGYSVEIGDSSNTVDNALVIKGQNSGVEFKYGNFDTVAGSIRSEGQDGLTINGTTDISLKTPNLNINNAYTLPVVDGTSNQLLTTNGAGEVTWEDAPISGLTNVSDDTTPELGGNLNVNGYNIISSSGNITLNPAASIQLNGLTWPSSDGTTGQVIQTDGSGNLSWVSATSGTLAALSDTSISTPSTNEVLTYNGSEWINGPAPSSGPNELNDLSDISLSAPISARYFRLNIASSSTTGVIVSGIFLAESVGGVNVLGNGTASASVSDGDAHYAFDFNNLGAYWKYNFDTGPWWLKYDFGAGNEKSIKEIKIVAAIYSSDTPRGPKDFDIQVSNDNVNWTTISQQSNVLWTANEEKDYYVGTNKGSLLAFSGSQWNDIPVGIDSANLVADSSSPLGIKWDSSGSSGATEIGQLTDAFTSNSGGTIGLGSNGLSSTTSGSGVTAVGIGAGGSLTTGYWHTLMGEDAGKSLTTVTQQTAIGRRALYSKTSQGNSNTAIGQNSLYKCTGGEGNVGLGTASLFNLSNGQYNTGVGLQAGYNISTGNYNTAVGFNSLQYITSMGYNASLGYQAGSKSQDGTNTISFQNITALGANSSVSASNQVQLGDSTTTTFAYGAVQDRSDERDKTDITDTLLGLDFINGLRPVDFRWDYREDYNDKVVQDVLDENGNQTFDVDGNVVTETITVKATKDGSRKRNRKHHGVIAQEVKALIDQTGIDFAGYQDHSLSGGCDVKSIGYNEFIAPLIKAVQELSSKCLDLQNQVDNLKSGQ